MTNEWSIISTTPPLKKNEIHLWKIELEAHLNQYSHYLTWLSEEELVKAQRFYTQELKNRYVIFHGKLRQILSLYLSIHPVEIEFFYSANGKPYLKHDISFNITHSHDLAIFAIGRQRKLGVDLECKRPIEELAHLCERFLSSQDCQEILAYPLDMRLDAFYRAWVRIEAYCKGHGGTLFDVLATLKKENLKVANLIDLTVCRFQAQESYESALAYEGHIDAVRFYYPKF